MTLEDPDMSRYKDDEDVANFIRTLVDCRVDFDILKPLKAVETNYQAVLESARNSKFKVEPIFIIEAESRVNEESRILQESLDMQYGNMDMLDESEIPNQSEHYVEEEFFPEAFRCNFD